MRGGSPWKRGDSQRRESRKRGDRVGSGSQGKEEIVRVGSPRKRGDSERR